LCGTIKTTHFARQRNEGSVSNFSAGTCSNLLILAPGDQDVRLGSNRFPSKPAFRGTGTIVAGE
jgi:hypothetical protein